MLFEQIHILKEARTISRQESKAKIIPIEKVEVANKISDYQLSPETNLASFRLSKKLKDVANSSEPPSLPSASAPSPVRPKFSAKNTGVGTADIDEIRANNDTTSPRALFPIMLSGGVATDELATPAIGNSIINANSETLQDTGRLGAGGVQT